MKSPNYPNNLSDLALRLVKTHLTPKLKLGGSRPKYRKRVMLDAMLY